MTVPWTWLLTMALCLVLMIHSDLVSQPPRQIMDAWFAEDLSDVVGRGRQAGRQAGEGILNRCLASSDPFPPSPRVPWCLDRQRNNQNVSQPADNNHAHYPSSRSTIALQTEVFSMR